MKRRLNVLEMNYLRRLKGISRRERIRNDAIGDAHIQQTIEAIETRIEMWNDLVI